MPTGERGLLEETELSQPERQLCAAAAEGRLVDLRAPQPAVNDPDRGNQWGADRRIRAQVVFQLLTGQGPELVDSVVAVRVRGARIVGRLNLGGSTLRCPMDLYDCYLDQRLDLAKAEAPSVSLRGTYVRRGLSARRLSVTHGLNLTGGFRCDGRAVLRGAHIGGQLNCEGATFTNEGGRALNAYGLTVDAGMFLRKAVLIGETGLLAAHIGGPLDCEGATFTNKGGEALTADGLTVDAGMFLRKAVLIGETRLLAAHIGRQLDCDGATFTNQGGKTLNLEQTSISGLVLMRPESLQGSINLTRARVGGWYDKMETWPAKLELDGFVYEAIDAPKVTVASRLEWLGRQSGGYFPQPYAQLAGVYRREGNDRDARRVEIAKQKARREAVVGWRQWPSRAWSWLLRYTIGYGYRPGLALIPLAVLLAAGSVIFDGAHPGQLRPAKTGPEQPGFNAVRYTLDLLLPVVNFKQRDAFIAHGYAAWVAFGFIFAGWLLAAVVVAGLGGVFKRD